MDSSQKRANRAAVMVTDALRQWWPEFVACYLVLILFHLSIATRGFPWLNGYEQVGWILLAILAVTFRSPRRLLRAAIHWLPFAGFLVIYGVLSNRADDLTGNVHDVSGLDEAVFGTLPTVWLQHHLWDGHVRAFDIAMAFIYLSHFLSITLTAAVLWARDRVGYRQFALALLLLSAAALATYAAFPAEPPWIASAEGHIPHVPRITNLAVNTFFGHSYAPEWDGYSPWDPKDYRMGNPFAAVPSLHAAVPVLLLLFFWRRAPRLRSPLILYTIAMFFAVVYLGEHYVIDIVLGVAYAIVCFVAGNIIRHWWSDRRSQVAASYSHRKPVEEPAVASVARGLPSIDGVVDAHSRHRTSEEDLALTPRIPDFDGQAL